MYIENHQQLGHPISSIDKWIISYVLMMHLFIFSKKVVNALFRCTQNSKILQDFPSHRIFERMHEVLNVTKQNN
jgi:hypothetical protein